VRSPNLPSLLLLLGALFVAVAPSFARAATDDADAAVPRRALPSPMESTNTCQSCHAGLADSKLRAPAKEYAQSAHRDERIGCAGCHKGDPQDPTVGAHKAAGFTPHPTHAQIPTICGGCHSDAAFMRVINGRIPVGQYALYQLSLHGKLTANGDPDAPACADCHGQHEIISPASPGAPVNRLHVAKLCASCHADKKKMSKYPIPTDQFDKWEHSVHGEAFKKGNPNAPTCTGCPIPTDQFDKWEHSVHGEAFKKGNPNAPTCTGCHGAHSAAPPDTSSVAHACGRCHEEEMNFFEQSPHSKGFRQRGLAQCVVCHSNHDVAPATELLVGTSSNATCMKCHSKDDKPREVAGNISALLGGARQKAAEARDAVKRAGDIGLHIGGAQYSLDKLATAELKLRAVVHTLDPARVQARVNDVEANADEAMRLVTDAEQTRGRERRGYFVALGLAGVLFVLLRLRAGQLDKGRTEQK
jgi:hypothetical protein